MTSVGDVASLVTLIILIVLLCIVLVQVLIAPMNQCGPHGCRPNESSLFRCTTFLFTSFTGANECVMR